jgi:hypothetical protein
MDDQDDKSMKKNRVYSDFCQENINFASSKNI